MDGDNNIKVEGDTSLGVVIGVIIAVLVAIFVFVFGLSFVQQGEDVPVEDGGGDINIDISPEIGADGEDDTATATTTERAL